MQPSPLQPHIAQCENALLNSSDVPEFERSLSFDTVRVKQYKSCLQERVFRRSQQLTQLVMWMSKLRPGVLPPETVLRVQVGIRSGLMRGALQPPWMAMLRVSRGRGRAGCSYVLHADTNKDRLCVNEKNETCCPMGMMFLCLGLS